MKATIVLVAVVGLTVAGGAGAAVDGQAAESLAKRNGCLTCHAADKRLVGPSFKEIAVRYKDDRDAESKLLNVIKKGGRGVWGATPMPATPQIKDDEGKTLVQWILAM